MSTMGSREAGRCVKETDAAVMGVSMVQGRADTGAGKLAMRRGSPSDPQSGIAVQSEVLIPYEAG